MDEGIKMILEVVDSLQKSIEHVGIESKYAMITQKRISKLLAAVEIMKGNIILQTQQLNEVKKELNNERKISDSFIMIAETLHVDHYYYRALNSDDRRWIIDMLYSDHLNECNDPRHSIAKERMKSDPKSWYYTLNKQKEWWDSYPTLKAKYLSMGGNI